jgi:coupling of ubiquitin conjugation to ER degradation protein 1
MTDKSTTSINLPQILVLLVIGFLALRWYFSSASTSNAGRRPAQNAPGRSRPVNPAVVEQIAQMFPQLNRRDIMWDLQRNGGSVQATTERVLSGRSLETVSAPARHIPWERNMKGKY